jgi:hypothetical protein
MAGQTDDDRPGREPIRALITACGVLLAGSSLAALILTDDPKNLRVAVVGALWAFLLVSITGRFRSHGRELAAAGESDEELRRFYQMELQQEVAARREYELRLEVQLRRELEESRTREIEELRAEVHRLRAELMGIEGPDRAALLASAARLSPEQLRVIREETQRPHPRPAERLQLPAGFSDSPPPGDSSPSSAAVPPSDPHPSLPGVGRPSAAPATFTPTEFIPAASHGAHGSRASHGGSASSSASSASSASHRLPEPYRGPAPRDVTPTPPPAYREPQQSQDARGTASAAGEVSGTYRTPSHSWSTYASPTASQELKRPTFASTPPATPPNGYDSSPSFSGSSSYDGYSTGTSTSGQHAVIEPYGSGPRHGAPSGEAGSTTPPYDSSNTWPGAFTAPRGETSPPQPRSPEPYPPQPAEWRPADKPASSRGRHHAGDDDEDSPATPPSRSRPDDDVLAQILGRW